MSRRGKLQLDLISSFGLFVNWVLRKLSSRINGVGVVCHLVSSFLVIFLMTCVISSTLLFKTLFLDTYFAFIFKCFSYVKFRTLTLHLLYVSIPLVSANGFGSKSKLHGKLYSRKFWILEGITLDLNSGNSCCRSVQNLLSSRLSRRNVNIKIYGLLIMPALVHGYESWSLILREVQQLSIFECRALIEAC